MACQPISWPDSQEVGSSDQGWILANPATGKSLPADRHIDGGPGGGYG